MSRSSPYSKTVIDGVAFRLQTVNNESKDGPWIVEPWRSGREIQFLLTGLAFPATTDLTVKVLGQLRDGGTAEVLKDKDLDDIEFTQTDLDDNGAFDVDGILRGSIPFAYVDTDKYKAIALRVANAVVTAMYVSATYTIASLIEIPPTGQTDSLYYRAKYGTVGAP